MMNCITSKIFYSISDSRWSEAVVEPYDFVSVTKAVQPIVESCFERQEFGKLF